LDSDGIERLEAVNDAKGFSVFLKDAKPSSAVGSIGGFVDASIYLSADNFTNFIVDTWRDGDILFDPRDVRNCRDFDGREEVFAEVTALAVCPREACVLFAHEVMHQGALCGLKEVRVIFVKGCAAFFCVAGCWFERRGIGIEDGYVGERISNDIADDVELVGESGGNRTDLLSNGFVLLLLRREDMLKGFRRRTTRKRGIER
jgi:hypothetical protein